MSEIILNPVEQTKKHDKMRNTYQFTSTKKILDVFENKGWQVSSIAQVNPRNEDKKGYQRHLIRLSHPDFPRIPGLSEDNESRPQICVLNSHDGTTALRLFLGVLRMACLNGIISGTALRDFKAVHSKNINGRIDNGIDYLTESMPLLFDQINKLQSLKIEGFNLSEFIKSIFNERLKNVNKIVKVEYSAPVLRLQDQASDAWTTLNRVQEYIIRGGIHYTYERDKKDDKGTVIDTIQVSTHTRPLKSIQSQIRLNRLVYDKALKLAS